MAGRGNAILAHWHTAHGGDFGADLGGGQDAPVAGLGALAELYFDHADVWVGRHGGETLRAEAAGFVAGTEITGADFPDEVAAAFEVVGADAALAGVVGEIAEFGAFVEGADGVRREGAEADGREVPHAGGVGGGAAGAADVDAELRGFGGAGGDGVVEPFEAI